MKRLGIVCVSIALLLLAGAWDRYESQSAYYPGGRYAMEKYFRDSLRYPEAEMLAGKEEIIWFTFEVSEKGVAQNPRMTSLFGSSVGFDEEVKRLIQDMPGWEPAIDRKGKPVTSTEHAMVRFELPDSLAKKYPLSADTSLYTNFDSVEAKPHFQGSEAAFQTYLMMTIRYPQMEKEQGKDGTVYIYFEVGQTGKIENVRCQKGVSGAPGLAKEGIRVISSMPRWVPALVDGKAVRSGLTVPIRFTLQ